MAEDWSKHGASSDDNERQAYVLHVRATSYYVRECVKIIIYTYKNGCLCICVCLCVCPGITLERLERFRPNLVYILLYVCVRILCMFYIYSAGRMVWEAGNLDNSHC
jgi:hypothetical protein